MGIGRTDPYYGRTVPENRLQKARVPPRRGHPGFK
jgi:hypothetical protein